MVVLSWNDIPDVDRKDFEIRIGTSWAAGTLVGRTATLSLQLQPMAAASYTFWIAARDTFGDYSAVPASVVASIAGPSAPTLSYAVASVNEILSWTIPTGGSLVDHYQISYGATWATATMLATTKATNYSRHADYSGARTYWVAGVDAAGNVGTPASVAVVITPLGIPTGIYTSIVDNNALIYWGAPATGTLPVASYEVRQGSTWASGQLVGSNGNSTFASVFEQTAGTYTFWVAGIDSAGTYGTPTSTTCYINQPPDYILRANIISAFCSNWNSVSETDHAAAINIVESSGYESTSASSTWDSARASMGQSTGRWFWEVTVTNLVADVMLGVGNASAAITGTFPGSDANGYGVESYSGKSIHNGSWSALGATFGTGDVIGFLLDMTGSGALQVFKNGVLQGTLAIGAGTWFPMFGLYTAGDTVTVNFGQNPFAYPQSITGNVNGSSNVLTMPSGAGLLLPVNMTETWAQHFANNGYSTPQDQINAGNTIYIEPGLTTASYTEFVDYGSALPATTILATLATTPIAGTVTASCSIQYKLNITDPWTNVGAGVTSALVSNFRYVQVTYTFTGSGGQNIVQVTGLTIKLSIKQRADSGTATSGTTLTTVGGVSAYWATVNFNYAFVSANCPVIQPNSSTAYVPIVAYTGGVNPTSFQVAFVTPGGANAAGVPFSWNALGY